MLIYIITSDRKSIKIGKTNNIDLTNRLRTIQTSLPSNIEVVEALMITGNNKDLNKIERQLHSDCKNWNINREWFECTNECINTLENSIDALIKSNMLFKVGGVIDDSTGKTKFYNPIGLKSLK